MQDVLSSLIRGIGQGQVTVVDLTQTLNANTPILELPPQWGQTIPFKLMEISRYDDRGRDGIGIITRPASTPAPTWTHPLTG